MEVELTAAEQRRRQDRASRFAEVDVNDIHFHAKPRRAKSATSRLVGTCTALEKPYLRLTSAPPPETVRPPRVLRRAFELAKTKWGGGGSSGGDGGDGEGRATTVTYAQSCEQFKSLRQDLVVQGVQGTLLAAAYATHARAALQSDDMGEFNQCLTGLRSLHESGVHAAQYELPAASQRRWKSRDGTRGGGGDGGKVGNDDEAEGAGRGTGRNKKRGRKRGRDGGGGKAGTGKGTPPPPPSSCCVISARRLGRAVAGERAEFAAYELLYQMVHGSPTEVSKVLASIFADRARDPFARDQPATAHAVEVARARNAHNYHRFFRLYKNAPSAPNMMSKQLIAYSVKAVRKASLQRMRRAYRPTLDMDFVESELGVEGGDERQECLDLLEEMGGTAIVGEGGEGGGGGAGGGGSEGGQRGGRTLIDMRTPHKPKSSSGSGSGNEWSVAEEDTPVRIASSTAKKKKKKKKKMATTATKAKRAKKA